MFNSKNTKRALVSSTIALVVCIAMLIGSTYAWFTDNVSSANNIVKSGNLDVEFEYSTNLKDWNKVTENTNIFKADALWEPGYTEVIYLKVSNLGSLALKYNLGINVVNEVIGKTKDNADIKLSDYIHFGIKENPTVAYANDEREVARADVAANANKISAGYTKTGTLEGKTSTETKADILALVVYMPETVGNEANHNGTNIPSINLGINVVATQMTAEGDSFGTDYDALATYPNGTYTAPAEDFTDDTPSDGTFKFENENGTFKISGNEDNTSNTAKGMFKPTTAHEGTNSIALKADGKELVSYDIKVENHYGAVKVEIFLGKNLINVQLFHDGVAVDASEYSYDAATGFVTFETENFSIFDFAFINPAKITAGNALSDIIAERDEIKLTQDLKLSGTITVPAGKTFVLDLNGKTISGETKTPSGSIISLFDVRGTLIVKNGKITAKHVDSDMQWSKASEIFYVGFGGKLELADATLEHLGGTAMAYCVDIVNADGATFNATNATIKSTYIPVRVFNNSNGISNVTIKNSTIDGVSRSFWVHIFTPADNNGEYKDATLNLDIYNNGNTYISSNPERIIEFGFDEPLTYNGKGEVMNAAAIQYEASKGDNEITLGGDINLNDGPIIIPGLN